jgi:hypothetical protein
VDNYLIWGISKEDHPPQENKKTGSQGRMADEMLGYSWLVALSSKDYFGVSDLELIFNT